MRGMRWKAKFILFSILCGVLYFVEQRYDFFRLREIDVVPVGILPDSIVWGAIPVSCEHFWLSLFLGGREFAGNIENFYPVELSVKISGWGRYRVHIKPLEPILYVSWRSNMWLLSKNGRMWLASHPSNLAVKGMVFPKKPILAWDSGLALPIDPESRKGDIFPSSLPMAKIKKWYDEIERIGWEEDIYCVLAKKLDGRPVVQLLLGSGEKISSEIVVKDDTADWASLAAALAEVFPGAGNRIPGGLVVNATFTDKFTVTSKDNR
ncbi:MAG: hypothetical protein LBT31_04445 [Synergistaceae bacterium]|jgi:hypothetical protein|nr:hypothetical protein [Synergistaceae bacterium]